MRTNTVLKCIIILLVSLIISVWYNYNTREQPKTLEQPKPAYNPENIEYFAKSDLEPVPFPDTSPVVTEADVSIYAPFTVELADNNKYDYYLRLKNIDNLEPDIYFYIRKDEMLETYVPHGEYYLYWAYGSEWYGTEHLFGARAMYCRADRTISFFWNDEENTSWGRSIYFEGSPDGNLTNIPVNISQFKD